MANTKLKSCPAFSDKQTQLFWLLNVIRYGFRPDPDPPWLAAMPAS